MYSSHSAKCSSRDRLLNMNALLPRLFPSGCNDCGQNSTNSTTAGWTGPTGAQSPALTARVFGKLFNYRMSPELNSRIFTRLDWQARRYLCAIDDLLVLYHAHTCLPPETASETELPNPQLPNTASHEIYTLKTAGYVHIVPGCGEGSIASSDGHDC